MIKQRLVILIGFSLFVLACRISIDAFDTPPLATPIPNLPASATPLLVQPTPTPVVILPTDAATPTVVNVPPLTVEQLKNGRFELPGADGALHTVQFQSGLYQKGTDPSEPGYVAVVMTDSIAFGDLDGDGSSDAAAVIVENYGGTGQFVSVVAFRNQGGVPVYAASYFVDDRAILNAFAIYNGEIYLDATIHGIEDPGCCPTMPTRQVLRLWQGALVLASFSSQTPTGAERIINIEAPANDVQVEKIFTLRGSVSIAPFENNLVYKVYIPGNSEPLTSGPLMVNAPDLGAPGTFELPLNFSASGYSGPVRITLSDLSAADGSLMALDTLFVVVK
ncbi:MAG: hypothetical protein DDG60_15075 [Anaerolineae bacterium]|nr:MAG: hypothetical protein DDG60_15075 [Anaerolineae bacterium]